MNKYRGQNVADCSCGGPEADGTGHAPDCAYVRACDNVDQHFNELDVPFSGPADD